MIRAATVVVVALVALTGCGGSSGTAKTPQACVDALHQADAEFNRLAADITTTRQALDEAFAGHVGAAQSTLQGVGGGPGPAEYKRLEAQCVGGG